MKSTRPYGFTFYRRCISFSCATLALLFLIIHGCKDSGELAPPIQPEPIEKAGLEADFLWIQTDHALFPFQLAFPMGTNVPRVQLNESFGRLEVRLHEGHTYWVTQEDCTHEKVRGQLNDAIFTASYVVENDSTLYYRLSLPDGSSAFYHYTLCRKYKGLAYVFSSDQRAVLSKSQTDEMILFIDASMRN
jgi:hypothetical protein